MQIKGDAMDERPVIVALERVFGQHLHAQAVANVSRFTKIPATQLQWAFTTNDFYRDSNLRPDVDSIQRGVNLLKEFGFIKANIDVPKYTDLTLIDEAATWSK